MSPHDRVRLLYGPYKAPALRRGDRAMCLFRDAEVVITSWADAPIPWPRCRAVDSPGPGSGLLVDEELARAVRHESAAAIIHWWRASSTAVQNWRHALGVSHLDTEGSKVLRQKGAAAMRAKFAAQPPRPPRPRVRWPWTEKEDQLVRTLAPVEAARRTGRTLAAVYQRRFALKLAGGQS
jgi:hypothetical protein